MNKKIISSIFFLAIMQTSAFGMELSNNDFVFFHKGTGSKPVMVFVSPGCPYCSKVLQKIDEEQLTDEYRFFVIPVAINKQSAKTTLLLSCVDNKKGLKIIENNDYSNISREECNIENGYKNLELSKKLGITSVPVIITRDKRAMSGCPDNLREFLEGK